MVFFIDNVLVILCSECRNLDLGTTLIFTGIYNIVTGLLYGVPMPVQPMKSIAAVAISNQSFGVPEIMAAGKLLENKKLTNFMQTNNLIPSTTT